MLSDIFLKKKDILFRTSLTFQYIFATVRWFCNFVVGPLDCGVICCHLTAEQVKVMTQLLRQHGPTSKLKNNKVSLPCDNSGSWFHSTAAALLVLKS